MPSDRSKYFSRRELECKHTGFCDMAPEFLERLDALREAFGKPLALTSAFRHPTHPVEAKKPVPGIHASGRAADIAVTGEDAYNLVRLAMQLGFHGIGVAQSAKGRFVHVDIRPRKTIWTY